MSNRLSCGRQHVDNLMKLMKDLSLNNYNYLFATLACLVQVADLVKMIRIELKYEIKDLLIAQVCA
jgi:predicted MarR family transcription regulator